MKLEKIITMANKTSYLRFIAMERSLRATACRLPLWVIPYDDAVFDLPENAVWVQDESLFEWLKGHQCRGVYRKYFCLLQTNYLFVDADVVFLENPERVLSPLHGFITSCGHWHNPGQTYTDESLAIFKAESTTWQQKVFNTGQFACDQRLFDNMSLLKDLAEEKTYINTSILFKHHEQPGLNLLVHLSRIPVQNLTLQPHCMQSTWAGDYQNDDYRHYWKNGHTPFIIHWAGCAIDRPYTIDELFLQFLSTEEKKQWNARIAASQKNRPAGLKKLRINLALLRQALLKTKWVR